MFGRSGAGSRLARGDDSIGRFARWDFNLHDVAGQRPIRFCLRYRVLGSIIRTCAASSRLEVLARTWRMCSPSICSNETQVDEGHIARPALDQLERTRGGFAGSDTM